MSNFPTLEKYPIGSTVTPSSLGRTYTVGESEVAILFDEEFNPEDISYTFAGAITHVQLRNGYALITNRDVFESIEEAQAVIDKTWKTVHG